MTCPYCHEPLCAVCGRCLRAGHKPDCTSPHADERRAWIASLGRPKERAVGAPTTLLELLLRSDEDATL